MRFLPVALVLLPVTARGALTLRMEDVQLRPGETAFVEAYFTETPPTVNERLVLYQVNLGISGDGGVRFGLAEQVGRTVDHPFVLRVDPRWVSIEPRVTDRSLIAFAETPTVDHTGFDIREGDGALRFAVTAAPGTPAGQASLVFDLNAASRDETVLVNDAGDVIPVTLQNGTITIVPEPASAGAVLLGASLVMLRRCRA